MNVYLHATRCILQNVVLHETVANYFPVLRAEGCFLSRPSGLAHGNAYHFVESPTDSCLAAQFSLSVFSVAAHMRNRAIRVPSDMQITK